VKGKGFALYVSVASFGDINITGLQLLFTEIFGFSKINHTITLSDHFLCP